MNENTNRRSSYVFKPLINSGNDLRISKVKSSNFRKYEIVDIKTKRSAEVRIENNINSEFSSYEKFLLNSAGYKKKKFKNSSLMSNIPALLCGEFLD